MKKNIIKGFAAAALVATMSGCSSDYLDLEPITSIDASTVTATVKGARYGLYGVCRTMWWPESRYGVGQRFIQGEAAVGSFYGELFSPDTMYGVWAPYGVEFMNWQYMRDSGTWITSIGWGYYYNLIAMSNRILDDIDNVSGDAAERDFIKAQLLTIRAHSYTRLAQIYAPRWENSGEGSAYCIVMRTKFSTEDTPLVTLKTVLNQVYADLDLAIGLYKSCGQKRTFGWEPDINVAYGVYARAAATQHDWAKCRDMARSARTGHDIMTADQYKGGFADPNGEWMWYNAPDYEEVGFWCWGAMYACNGAYVSFWGDYGAGSINYDLIRELQAGDIRSDLYLTPESIQRFKNMGMPSNLLPTKANFWNKQMVKEDNMDLNNKNAKLQLLVQLMNENNVPGGDEKEWGLPYQVESGQGAASTISVPFGAQYKFWGRGIYSVSSFPFMRGGEFAMLEAEACYRLNDETGAKAALTDVNSQRIPNYTCSTSGDALWKEIMTTSRIELWGEGHSWYNLKRWNIEVERRPWIAGDKDSNNMPKKFGATFPTKKHCGWAYKVPNSETRYNHAVNVGLLPQDN